MKALIDAALSHSRTGMMVMVLLLISGTYAYISIPKEADPDVNIPTIYVSMHLDGISPEDAERLLVKPMEQELSSIEGTKEVKATAYESGANITLEFEAGFDADQALTDVREAVDIAKPELPAEADEPTVNEVNISLFPVLTVKLSGDVTERSLQAIARDLRDRIETIPTVLEANIVGAREERVELIIDPLKLESYGLDARAILQSVDASNRLVAAGSLDTGQGRNSIKVPGLFEDAEDILTMPVKVDGDAVVIIADVADLRSTFEDPESYVRVNGNPGLAIEVSKRTGANIIETIEYVKAVVNATSDYWPEQLNVSFSQDKSTDIRNMLSDLQNNVTSAILLVMIVIVAAMGLRSAGLVGVAIPGSFLTGILVLYLMGFTVNIVVLFSLILAVGMLVDGAIVVTEYADRKMTEGEHRRKAYNLAAKRMAWPITASTATTLAAFLPLMFWPGIVGEFMKYLPLTLIATLSASLFMALIFIPTLGSLIGKSGAAADPTTMKALAAGEKGDLRTIRGGTGLYLKILDKALKAPGLVIICAVLLLVGIMAAYSKWGEGVEFFPEVEPDNMVVWIHGRGNMSIDERDALVQEIENEILAMHQARGEFHAINATSTVTSGRGGGPGGEEPEDLIGKITLEFVDWDLRRPASEIIAEIEDRSAPYAGIQVEVRKEEAGPPVGKPIQIQVGSFQAERIVPVVEQILGGMEQISGFKDIEDGRPNPGIDWELTVNRAQADKFGANVQLIGQYVQLVTRGLIVTTFRPDTSDEELDFVVRVPELYRTLDFLDAIVIQTDAGQVPISNFVERHAVPSQSMIYRSDGQRVRTIKAELAVNPETGEPYLADAKVREIKEWMDTQDIDPRVTVTFKGEDEEQQEASAFLSKAFVVALFLMAIILVTQFNSFYSAFLILCAVIMSTIGVMIGLLVTGQPFGIVMAGIGVIALAGIVVNNNIVLIDTFDRLKEDIDDVREAILRTGAQRLRPVLLTTITTILGLMPMVLSMNIDFLSRNVSIGAPSTQWWTQLSTTIVFGLAFATVLTLVFTPCALMIRANLQAGRYSPKKLLNTSRPADGPTASEPTERPSGLPAPWNSGRNGRQKPEAAE